MSEKASIGIIGGADGPTAVIISGDPIGFLVLAVLCIAVVGLIIHWLLKR